MVVSAGLNSLPETLGETQFPCLFQLQEVAHIPWLVAHFLHLQSQLGLISLTLLPSWHLSLTPAKKTLCFLRTHVIRKSTLRSSPIARPKTFTTSAKSPFSCEATRVLGVRRWASLGGHDLLSSKMFSEPVRTDESLIFNIN